MLTRRTISTGLSMALLGGPALARVPGAPAHPWPNGARAAVSLTYDDGLDSQLDNAAAPLAAAGLRATFFLTLANADARLADWTALARSGGHEVGHHTVSHPCDLRPYTAASFAQREIAPMQAWLDNNFGPNPDRLFAYPCSATNLGAGDANRQLARYEALLKASGFRGARTCDEDAPNSPGYALADPYRLRASATTYDQDDPGLAVAYVRQAMKRGDWAILVFHDIVKQRAGPGDTSIATHQAVLDWLAAQPVWCAPMGQVLGHIGGQVA
ncbi:MAG TPA: polysaccharide deacetylase family protein [Caulobacteraceae bacterium]|jgi:peptidoglycan/xylan/chitin deacetylase (PgdA/CDA1 family)|nr:polysaccharide deacetylase family protein [Caulobacteraceae bacterium]